MWDGLGWFSLPCQWKPFTWPHLTTSGKRQRRLRNHSVSKATHLLEGSWVSSSPLFPLHKCIRLLKELLVGCQTWGRFHWSEKLTF